MMHKVRLASGATAVAAAVWIAAIVAGMCQIWTYETTAGRKGTIAASWPTESSLPYESDCAHLLLFAHPRCPCTRATLEELARLMTRAQGRVVADVVFIKPAEANDAWVQDDLWRRALEIPGVRAVADAGGREQTRFGVNTSGHVLLYSPIGELVFSGGITASRGHEGDNAGAAAIVQWLRDGRTIQSETAAFGCSFSNP